MKHVKQSVDTADAYAQNKKMFLLTSCRNSTPLHNYGQLKMYVLNRYKYNDIDVGHTYLK